MPIFPALRPHRVFVWLLLAVAGVLVIGTLADVVLMGYPGPAVQETLHRFSLLRDASMPTWVASVILLVCGVMLAIAAQIASRTRSRQAKGWWLIACIFFLLSMDEVATVHELSGILIDRLVPSAAALGGVLTYSWVLAAIPLLIVLAVILLPWFLSLARPTQILFGTAAVVFVSGAVGMEMLNALLDSSTEENDVPYALTSALEEALEYLGSLIFLYALLTHLRQAGVSLTITPRQESAPY